MLPSSEIQIYEGIDDVLFERWLQLYERSSEKTFFQHPSWTKVWLSSKSRENVRVCCLFVDDRLEILTPLRIESASRCVISGNEHTDYNMILVGEGSEGHLQTFLAWIGKQFGTIVVSEIPKASIQASSLANLRTVFRDEVTHCPRIDLLDFNHVQDLLSKKSTNRKTKMLYNAGEVRVEHTQELEKIGGRLSEFIDLHIERWKATASPSMFRDDSSVRLYQGLIENCVPLVWSGLYLDDELVAGHIGIVDRKSLLWYKPAYSTSHSKLSPGEILLREVIRYAIENNYHSLDFTRGDEPYKYRYANLTMANENLVICRRRIHSIGLLAHSELLRQARRVRSKVQILVGRRTSLE